MKNDKLELIERVHNKFKHMKVKAEKYSPVIRMSNIAFSSELNFKEIGSMAFISKFNTWTPADSKLSTCFINVNTIISSLDTTNRKELNLLLDSLDSLVDKGVIDIEYYDGRDVKFIIRDNNSINFRVTQKLYTNEENLSDTAWEALYDVPQYKGFMTERSATVMYLDDVEKILFSSENINMKIKMLAMYAAICKPIFYYKKDNSSKLPKIDLAGRSINWDRIEDVGAKSGYKSIVSIRKLIKLLYKHNIIERVDVRFGGNTVYHNRAYFCRYDDAYVMAIYVIQQIKDNKIFNILDSYKV